VTRDDAAIDGRTAALLDALRALPIEELEVRARGGTRVYRGVSLFAFAASAGLVPDTGDDALASGYLVVTASDGARAALAVAELAPTISDRRVLLATEQDGQQLRVGVRLVVPREGSRSLLGVVGIDVKDAAAEPRPPMPSPGPGEGTGNLELLGLLQRPGFVDLTAPRHDLTTMETVPGSSHGEPIAPRSYTGVPVSRLLGELGMYFMTEGEELHSKVVVARSADGHVAVLAAGEFGPHNAKSPAIVAVARDGAPLSAHEGPLRLITPYDRLSARWVQHLISLELREC
jgi:hypothetical protein